MNWKNSTFWFAVQALKFGGVAGFAKYWSYKKRWEASFAAGRNSVADEQAWLNFPALDFLDEHLTSEMRVFEFGGGGSTLFFLNRVGFVATVENDGEWFQILSEKVKAKTAADRWQGFFQKGEPAKNNSQRSPDQPADFMSNAPGEANLSYEKYAKTIHQFEKSFFDVVLVDGRARPSCVAESLEHLKRGGLLVVDNMERAYYHTAFQQIFSEDFTIELDGRFPVPYHPDFTNTMILKKK